jgi:hypothetical protein
MAFNNFRMAFTWNAYYAVLVEPCSHKVPLNINTWYALCIPVPPTLPKNSQQDEARTCFVVLNPLEASCIKCCTAFHICSVTATATCNVLLLQLHLPHCLRNLLHKFWRHAYRHTTQ